MTQRQQARFKLLLVEDNPGDADLARERLSDIPDYDFEINSVTRLADAISALQEAPVDAVVLDLNLPDSHGLETLRALRRIRREMAIIVLSGNTDDALRAEALQEGAQEFLSKSEPTSRLVARSFVYALERHRSQEQQRRIEHLVAANPDALIAVDEAHVVRFANEAALSLFGRTAENFIGQPLGHRIAEDAVSEIYFDKDGEAHTAEVRAAAFEWDGKRAYLAAIRDVTEQRQLGEQLMQSRKMEALGLLAGGVAHDFNNLLTVIVNCATFLADAIDKNDPNRRDVDQILSAADRAEALIAQLLALTRKKPIQPRVVDLADAVTGLEVLLRRTLPADIEIASHVVDGLWPVYVDRGRIDQLLMNLAVNAKDAMPQGGHLNIWLENMAIEHATEFRPAGEYVSLKVSDTGQGIPPNVLKRVFDPFFTTKAPGKGTGLGLATCYAIVRQAGGDIGINSKVGTGTTVSVLLPRVNGIPDEDPFESAIAPIGGEETILVVEDDPDVLGTIVSVLGKYGYLVISAPNGEDGLRLATTYGDDIDLVLSDIVMPGMNGHELAGALKDIRPRIKVLLMSGYDKAQGDEQDAAGILFKPFRPAGLLRRVRQSLDHGRGTSAGSFMVR